MNVRIVAVGACCGRGLLQAGYVADRLRNAGIPCDVESRKVGERLELHAYLGTELIGESEVGDWEDLADLVLQEYDEESEP